MAAVVAGAGLAAAGAGGFDVASATTGQTACRLVEVGGYTLSARNTVGSYTHYASGGVDYRCADGVRIVADSAVGFETNSTLNLYGSVRFEDPEVILEAGQAIYFGEARYLRATHGSQVEYKNTGTVVSGEELDYYRQSELRTVDEMTVRGGRPHAKVYPQVASEASDEQVPPPEEAPPEEEAPPGEAPGEGTSDEERLPEELPDEEPADEERPLEEPLADEPPPGEPPAQELPAEEQPPEELSADDSPPEELSAEELPDEESLPDEPPVEEPPDDEPPPEESSAEELPPEDRSADELPDEESLPDEPPVEEPPDEPPAPQLPPVELPPYEIEADRFVVEGRQAFRAVNNVVLVRDSLRATGDTLYYDQGSGAMSLRGEPRVGDGRFDLTARSVSITPASPGNENILARGEASLSGAAVAIEAPAIRLFLDGGDLGRLVALATVPADSPATQPDTAGMTPGDQARVAEMIAAVAESDTANTLDSVPRPSAYAEDLTLVADSIEVLSPAQTLRALTAVGTAQVVAVRADSADEDTPEVARSDWMEGDTVVASFLPPSPGRGSGTGPRAAGRALLETLVAAGNARSLYRVPPDTTIAADEHHPTGPPPLHWTQGERITMHLADGEVVRMLVEGQTVGYHFEPQPHSHDSHDSTTAVDSTVADSTAAADSMAADSTAVVDSMVVDPTTVDTTAAASTPADPTAAADTTQANQAAVPTPTDTLVARPWRRRP